MLSKKELNFLNKLLESEEIKAKKKLEGFIWRNTIKPKYKIGDIVKFNDFNKYHFGIHPLGWVGVITEINYNYDNKKIMYNIVYQYQLINDNHKEINKTFTYQEESKIISKCRLERINIIDKPKNKDSEYFYI